MLRTQIYLPVGQFEFLKKRAFEENLSVSEAIRRLIEKELVKSKESQYQRKNKNVGDWLLSLSAQAKKLKIKGPPDLAARLDQYLYGER